jgi:hypothetical protein
LRPGRSITDWSASAGPGQPLHPRAGQAEEAVDRGLPGRPVLPPRAQRGDVRAEAVGVRVPVLRDDRSHPPVVPQRDAEPDRGPEVEHVDRIVADAERVDHLTGDVGEPVEGRRLGQRVGRAEPRVVDRDDVPAAGQPVDQPHVRPGARRIARQQNQGGALRVAGLPDEHPQTLDLDVVVTDGAHVSSSTRS